MKLFVPILISIMVTVECGHMFFGTNVQRPLVYNKKHEYGDKWLSKRIEHCNVTLAAIGGVRPIIQGVLAYDLTNTTASANVTGGGLGHDFVNIRMKSERGKKLRYDIYIFA